MQKFTRALTREVEVGGERLAVTLDAGGVTVRPVGSRRPPHHLGWPAVVSAATGQPDLAEALAALKRGAGGRPDAAPLMSPPPGDLAPLLARLDDWLAKHRDRYHEALLAGALPEELDALAKALGQPLPAALRQWLGWHNGQHIDLIGGFYEAFNLMSAEQIAAAWQDRAARAEPGWDRAWIPLLDDYQDDLIVLDPAQPGCAVREVWRGRADHPVVAPSLAAWLEHFVADVEAGRYLEDPERGEFRRVKG
jgi:cell wall assembly regulator SMI1